MVKIIRSYGVKGKRDELGNMINCKFTLGFDNSGNMYAKHNESCDTNMNLIKRDFKTKKYHFSCPKCNKVLRI